MKKPDLISWLQEQQRQWEALLEQFGPARMDQPDVAGPWSMKDVVAHLTGWNRHLVARLQAARRGEPDPPPPWPAHLQDEDHINAWIYEANRERPVSEVLDESRQVFQRLLALIECLPEDVRIDTIEASSGREFYLVWIGDKRFPVGEFFDHLRDDHEPDIRAWLERKENTNSG